MLARVVSLAASIVPKGYSGRKTEHLSIGFQAWPEGPRHFGPGNPRVETLGEDKDADGDGSCPERAVGIQPSFIPRTPTQAGSLCYIALQSVERFVEMLPEARSALPPLPRDGVSVA